MYLINSINTDSELIKVKSPEAELKEEQQPQRFICKIPVNDGVTVANLLSIPLITCVCMLVASFQNAQIIYLLADPDLFDVPIDKIGYWSGLLSSVS